MTAKERAQQIVDRFLIVIPKKIYAVGDSARLIDDKETAKDCAFICVEEIIRQTEWVNGSYPVLKSETQLYNDVKKEIEKL